MLEEELCEVCEQEECECLHCVSCFESYRYEDRDPHGGGWCPECFSNTNDMDEM